MNMQTEQSDILIVDDQEDIRLLIQGILEDLQEKGIPSWLTLDEGDLVGKVIELPNRGEVPVEIQEQLIVEFSSR